GETVEAGRPPAARPGARRAAAPGAPPERAQCSGLVLQFARSAGRGAALRAARGPECAGVLVLPGYAGHAVVSEGLPGRGRRKGASGTQSCARKRRRGALRAGEETRSIRAGAQRVDTLIRISRRSGQAESHDEKVVDGVDQHAGPEVGGPLQRPGGDQSRPEHGQGSDGAVKVEKSKQSRADQGCPAEAPAAAQGAEDHAAKDQLL